MLGTLQNVTRVRCLRMSSSVSIDYYQNIDNGDDSMLDNPTLKQLHKYLPLSYLIVLTRKCH